MSGNDVVIAAETGSGKTHGYLVPLINKIFNDQRGDKLTDGDQDLASVNKLSLVLCPNVMLCEQVVQMANTLCDEHGKSLLRVTAVCGRQVKKKLSKIIYDFNHVDMILSLTKNSNCRVGQFTSRILFYQHQQLYLIILNQTGVDEWSFFVLWSMWYFSTILC